MVPAFEAIATEQGWGLLTRTKSECVPVSVPVLDRERNPYGECSQWRQEVFDEVARIEPDMVVLAGSDNAVLADDPDGAGTQLWNEGWTATIESIAPNTGHVVTLSDTLWAQEIQRPIASRSTRTRC
ncbi:hypothetical protein GCM10029992_05840 [Glycomyces albus]